MTVEQLKKDLQNNNLKNVYFFCGDEEYLIQSYIKKFKDLVDKDMRDFNLSEVEGDVQLEDLVELITPYPMLSDIKVVFVRESGLLSAYDKRTEEFMSMIPDYAIVIFTEQMASKVSKKLTKMFEDKCDVVDFSKRAPADLRTWINIKLKEAGKSISPNDAMYLIDLCDASLYKLDLELGKMIAYVGDRSVVTKQDIDDMLPPDNEYKAYELADKLISGKKVEAYEMLRELKQSAEPIVVLSGIFYQLNSIVMVKYLKADKEPIDSFFPANRKFLAKKIASTYGNRDMAQLRRAMTDCARYDADIKMGRIDGWTAVELVMAQF
ncbi:MAG: DNA polymerase III subunit delta [Eubacteriales bacterium]|nr:DNA polymerase III subunit delta [Eubacteriales bacterium]